MRLIAPLLIAVAAAAITAPAACSHPGPGSHPGSGPHPRSSRMPGPGPQARSGEDAAEANARCERCHAEAAASWRTSLHAQAWVDPIFQRSFAEEPAAFCRDCHAPETASPALGVACVTCHDPAGTGEILAAPGRGSPREPAPHRVLRDPAFADDRACASCHDFPFPDVARRGGDGARMQRTVAEHRGSRFADRSCASCHMPAPAGGTHQARGHAFTVASDPSMLKRALVARAARSGEHLRIDLAPGEVGHSFPTGDLFRRLVVFAEVLGDDYQLVAHAERVLARHFRFETNAHGHKVQREIADDRVDGPREVDLDVGALARGRPIVWRIEWQRIQSMHGEDPVIAATVVVAEGTLPAEPGGPHR